MHVFVIIVCARYTNNSNNNGVYSFPVTFFSLFSKSLQTLFSYFVCLSPLKFFWLKLYPGNIEWIRADGESHSLSHTQTQRTILYFFLLFTRTLLLNNGIYQSLEQPYKWLLVRASQFFALSPSPSLFLSLSHSHSLSTLSLSKLWQRHSFFPLPFCVMMMWS